MKSKINDVIGTLRNRRGKTRRRLEDVFDRKTFASITVIGTLGKVMETSIVPLIDPLSSVAWTRAMAWLVMFFLGILGVIRWEQLSRMANEAADKAEEVTEE